MIRTALAAGSGGVAGCFLWPDASALRLTPHISTRILIATRRRNLPYPFIRKGLTAFSLFPSRDAAVLNPYSNRPCSRVDEHTSTGLCSPAVVA